MPLLGDRVQESTTTGGTGTLTLAGAVTGYRTFNSVFSNGDVVYYTIDDGTGNWEVGYGTVGTGTLTRSVVLDSSNAGSLVSFAAGTAKRVFCTAPTAAIFNQSTGGTVNGALTVTGTTTLATSLTGLLKGTSGVVSTATSGTDYAPATSGTSILKGNGSGGFSNAVANTDYLAVNNPIATGVLKLNGSSSGYVGLQGAAAAGSTTYTLPSADGSNGQVLSTNGTGTLSWTTAATTITISNDTSTATNVYPAFLSATTGTASTLYTGNARLLYTPSTGAFQSTTFRSGNGLFVNSATVSENQTIASGDNATSAGPVTVASGITVTVSSGSVWVVV